MSTCPVLNLVQSIFSCLAALTNPDVYLSWASFSSSLVDIRIYHNQWKLEEVFYRSHITITRLASVLKTIFHQCVLSHTCSQSNSDGSVKTEPSELDWLQVYDRTHWWKIVLRTGASLNNNRLGLETIICSYMYTHCCAFIYGCGIPPSY